MKMERQFPSVGFTSGTRLPENLQNEDLPPHHSRVKRYEGRNISSPATIFVLAVLMAYLAGYFVLRQSAARGTIFITATGSRSSTPMDYRGINLSPKTAKWVHWTYSPIIALDRKWTGTVVTVNIPRR